MKITEWNLEEAGINPQQGRRGCLESQWIRERERGERGVKYYGREVKGRLRPGGRRRLKSFPPSWNLFSARGQKNAKMLHFFSLRLLCQPASASVSLAVCFQMSSEPLWATVVSYRPLLNAAVPVFVGVCVGVGEFCFSFVAPACNELYFTGAHQKICF